LGNLIIDANGLGAPTFLVVIADATWVGLFAFLTQLSSHFSTPSNFEINPFVFVLEARSSQSVKGNNSIYRLQVRRPGKKWTRLTEAVTISGHAGALEAVQLGPYDALPARTRTIAKPPKYQARYTAELRSRVCRDAASACCRSSRPGKLFQRDLVIPFGGDCVAVLILESLREGM